MRNEAFYLAVVMCCATLGIFTVALWMLGFIVVSLGLGVFTLATLWPACKAARRWAESIAAALTN